MRRLTLLLAAVLAAGCGGKAESSAPSEEPGRAMQRLVKYELAGHLEQSYAMLIREQRAVVGRDLYLRCPPGPPIDGVTVLVLNVSDETVDVPGVGRTKTKAVQWRMTLPDAQGNPLVQSDTGHLIAQDGQWRWMLSKSSFESFKQRVCPY